MESFDTIGFNGNFVVATGHWRDEIKMDLIKIKIKPFHYLIFMMICTSGPSSLPSSHCGIPSQAL